MGLEIAGNCGICRKRRETFGGRCDDCIDEDEDVIFLSVEGLNPIDYETVTGGHTSGASSLFTKCDRDEVWSRWVGL